MLVCSFKSNDSTEKQFLLQGDQQSSQVFLSDPGPLSQDRGPDLDPNQDEVQCQGQDWDQGPGLGSKAGSRIGVRTESRTWFMAGVKTSSRHSRSSEPGCDVSISEPIKRPDSFLVCSVK